MSDNTNNGPLDGITVLDLSVAMAGPYSATILADLGARVIKVEMPGKGDLTRQLSPRLGGHSATFLALNRGKESMTLDLRGRAGQKILERMVKDVHVVVSNFRPGLMEEWHLSFDRLLAINHSLIYCTLSAYGDARGLEKQTGFDETCQGYAGLMDLNGLEDVGPYRVGAPIIDAAAGLNLVIGILAALLRCRQTGRGEHVRVSLLESAFSLVPNFVTAVLSSDTDFRRLGGGDPQSFLMTPYRCSDNNWLSVVVSDRAWSAFCAVLGLPELEHDPRFVTYPGRVTNREDLHVPIVEALKQRPRDEWIDALQGADIPAAPVLTLRESLHRFTDDIPGFTVDLHHDEARDIRGIRPAFQFAAHPAPPAAEAGPVLSRDTDRLLAEFGYEAPKIADLRADGVI